jgi:hypothetical protein
MEPKTQAKELQRWETEGGRPRGAVDKDLVFRSALIDNRIKLPRFEHKEVVDEDDCGPPKDPIFADYAKYLWKSHVRSGGVQAPNRSPQNTDGGDRSR